MSTTLEQSQYGFDRASRRTWPKRPLTTLQDQQYNYDTLSQVSAAARGSLNLNATAISGIPASAESWDYDPTGNWRGYHSAASGSTTLDQHRVHDRGNRMTQIEDNPNNMLLDRAGRMLQLAPDAGGNWDGKLELMWDAWSRITRVKNNGATVGVYGYDGTHRRITRVVEGVTLHSYYNDAWRPVEERKDDDTTACTSYLWGTRFRDDLVRRDRAVGGTTLNETRYILMDYFNPSAITDETGAVKERYAFSAFGLRTIMNADYTERSDSECGMEFAFQGQFLDAESGLMNYGYRYYSPPLGRWTCKDPIGISGGVSLYQFCENYPTGVVDLLGLIGKSKCSSTIFAGHGWHTPGSEAENKMEQAEKQMGACDRVSMVGCFSGDVNARHSSSVKSGSDRSNDPEVPDMWKDPKDKNQAKRANPAEPGYIFPKDAYAALAEKVVAAKSQAEQDCKDPETCCKQITVIVRCSPGDTEFNDVPRNGGEILCGKSWTLDCKSKKWKNN